MSSPSNHNFKYRALLFDWDGTIVDTLKVWWDLMSETFERAGVNLTNEQQRFGLPRWERLFDTMDITPEQQKQIIGYGTKTSADRIKTGELYPGVAKVLETIHNSDVKTGLITLSPKATLGNLLEQHGLIGAFDAVIAFEDVEDHKPHPAPLLKAMEELGVDPEETVMVGDGTTDLIAADRAGVDALLYAAPANADFYDQAG